VYYVISFEMIRIRKNILPVLYFWGNKTSFIFTKKNTDNVQKKGVSIWLIRYYDSMNYRKEGTL